MNSGTMRLTVLICLAVLVNSCSPRSHKNNPIGEPTPTVWRIWDAAESAISEAFLGEAGGKCEWQMLGWMQSERYIWAVCTSGSGMDARGASGAAVVQVEGNGTVVKIIQPKPDKDFSASLMKLFPPSVRAKILKPDFDEYSYINRLEQRWNNPAIPPAIYEQTRELMPARGDEAIPAISASSVGRITQLAELGSGNVNQVAFLPDGRIAVNGDTGIRFVDMAQPEIKDVYGDLLQGSAGFLSPDGKMLAVLQDPNIVIYNTADKSIINSIGTYDVGGRLYKVTFLPDGMTILVEKNIPSESLEVRLAMYRFTTGEMTAVWSPSGGAFVTSPNGLYAVGLYSQMAAQVWYLPEGKLWKSLPGFISAAAFSGDGQILAVSELSKVKLYWVWDGFEIGRLEADIGPVDGLALSPDGNLLLTWSRENYPARLWSVPDFKPLRIFFDVKGVSAAAFNSESSKLIMAGDTIFARFDVVADVMHQHGFETYNSVADISFSPDSTAETGQRMAVLYRPGNSRSLVVNWDLTTRKAVFEYPATGIFQMEYLPEPYGIALGGEQGMIRIINSSSGDFIRELRSGETFSVQSMSVSPGSPPQLASGFMSVVRIFNLGDDQDTKGRPMRVSGGWTSYLAWNRCFLATGVGGTVYITDEMARKFTQNFEIPYYRSIQGLAILPDCSEVLAADSSTIFRWNAVTGESLSGWSLPDQILAMAVSPDGTLVAVSLFDKSVRLLDPSSGEELGVLPSRIRPVTALQFSPDGSLLATGGYDGVVILWGIGK